MARATSIISTSGAGVSLEARIAGIYLAALLIQADGPGDEAATWIEGIDFQRTDPAAGFDDLHVHHRQATGGTVTTYLQIKRTLTGSRSETAFRRPVGDAAAMLKGGANSDARFRIAASQSAFKSRDVDRARTAARLSSDASDFWTQWDKPGASSSSEREYTSAISWVIAEEQGAPDPDLAWRVISRLGVIELDADQSGSQAISYALERLQSALLSEDGAQALQLFETICQFAENAAKVSGRVTRAHLVAELAPRYRLKGAVPARQSLERIAADADTLLKSIRDDIAGVRLAREDLTGGLSKLLEQSRGIRLGGEAGAGKSAVLRSLTERLRDEGAGLLVLKHDRLTATDWASHSALLKIDIPLGRLIEELVASGSAILVIDGFDRMMEAGFDGLVREICDAIIASPSASLWRGLVSSRDSAGPEPSLNLPILKDIQPFQVGAPGPKDLARRGKSQFRTV